MSSSTADPRLKACLLTKREGRSALVMGELDGPRPGPGEVLIGVRAAALNHLDLYAFDHHAADAGAAPKIIGSDASGVVLEVGDGVGAPVVGDEVVVDPGLSCGRCEHCRRGEQSQCPRFDILGRGVPGTFAERLVVPAGNVAPKPEHLDFPAAAALPLAHLTAARMLFARGGLRPGESVLVHGIGGGVALAALQLAKRAAARVLVTSSSPAKLERAAELGADDGLLYPETDVAAEVRVRTAGRGVDLVIDTVGAATLAASVAAARNGGRVVVCGATSGAEAVLPVREVFWRQIAVVGSTMGSVEDFRRMLAAVEAGRLEPVIDSVRPLAAAGEALERMRRQEQLGKLVLTIGGREDGED